MPHTLQSWRFSTISSASFRITRITRHLQVKISHCHAWEGVGYAQLLVHVIPQMRLHAGMQGAPPQIALHTGLQGALPQITLHAGLRGALPQITSITLCAGLQGGLPGTKLQSVLPPQDRHQRRGKPSHLMIWALINLILEKGVLPQCTIWATAVKSEVHAPIRPGSESEMSRDGFITRTMATHISYTYPCLSPYCLFSFVVLVSHQLFIEYILEYCMSNGRHIPTWRFPNFNFSFHGCSSPNLDINGSMTNPTSAECRFSY